MHFSAAWSQMVSNTEPYAVPTSTTAHVNFRPSVLDLQPVPFCQTECPCCPLSLPCEVTALRPAYMSYARVLVPSWMTPHLYSTQTRPEMPHTYPDWEMDMDPNFMRETLTLLDCSNSWDGSQRHPHEEIYHSKQQLDPQHGFLPVFSNLHHTGTKQSEGFSVERCRREGTPDPRSQIALTQYHSANFTCADMGPLQSRWPTAETEFCADTADENEASNMFHSIMVDDKSILTCVPSEDVKAYNSDPGPATTHSEAVAVSTESMEWDQSVIKVNAAETSISSSMPRVTTCDVMVGSEPALCTSAFTQTDDPGTSDKHVITEVHMADLDYLAEEFIRLKMAKEDLRKQKETMKSLGCRHREECGCVHRAQRAELCLLALQYNMCTQHCWRLYYVSAEGGQLTPQPENPPANVVSVLQQLECDYNQMRDKILAGVPLEQLKPLSVDSEKITTGASYIPAQIIGDVLGHVPSWSLQEPHSTSGEANRSPDNQNRNGCQHSRRREQIKNSKGRRVSFVPQRTDAVHNANKQESATCKEFNTSEAWYDAEEDLDPAGPAVAAETRQDPTVINKDKSRESSSEEAKSSVLCVSNIPSAVTESDVMLWFEKYHASEVSISALKNDLRVAIVMISGPQSAEAAVRELNGCSMQGHILHVEHINRATGGSHGQGSASIMESSQETTNPQTSKTESSSTERQEESGLPSLQLIAQPPLSSSIKTRKVVCISPTAKGTFVPPHYGTMDSFDTLTAELTQRHPDVGRQRIMDALMELKANYRGVLSSLPLRTIREMTSELLSRPTSVAHL